MIGGNVAAMSSAKKDAILLASDSWRLYALRNPREDDQHQMRLLDFGGRAMARLTS
jgi:hypothetical protein